MPNFYSLGYRSAKGASDRPHKIEVTVKKKGLRVRTRTSFVEKSVETRTAEAVLASLHYARSDNPLQASMSVGDPKPYDKENYLLPVRVAVPIGKLGLLPSGDRYEGQFFVYFAVLDVSGKQSDLQIQRQQVTVPAKDLAAAQRKDFYYDVQLIVVPGGQKTGGRRPGRGVQPDVVPPEERLRLGAAQGEAHGAGAQAVIPILDARRMRAADAAAIRRGTPSNELMERAAEELCGAIGRFFPDWARAVVVCGPGNNGGDGLAAARMLVQRGIAVDVFTLGDPSAYRGDPAVNLARAGAFGLVPRTLASRGGFEALRRGLDDADGVVDALFGTGLGRRLEGNARRAVEAINLSGRPVVSADVPSGLSADDGAIAGPAVRAVLTVAFGAPKPCHVLAPSSALCGRVVVADIGIPRATLEQKAGRVWLAEPSDVRSLLPARPLESHKADFGRLAIVAGSRGKAGAAILAARGALRAGAGLVTVFCAESLEDLVVAALPEAMTFGLPEVGGSPRGARRAFTARCAPGIRRRGGGPGPRRFVRDGPLSRSGVRRGAASRRRRRGRVECFLRACRLFPEAARADRADAASGRGRRDCSRRPPRKCRRIASPPRGSWRRGPERS